MLNEIIWLFLKTSLSYRKKTRKDTRVFWPVLKELPDIRVKKIHYDFSTPYGVVLFTFFVVHFFCVFVCLVVHFGPGSLSCNFYLLCKTPLIGCSSRRRFAKFCQALQNFKRAGILLITNDKFLKFLHHFSESKMQSVRPVWWFAFLFVVLLFIFKLWTAFFHQSIPHGAHSYDC